MMRGARTRGAHASTREVPAVRHLDAGAVARRRRRRSSSARLARAAAQAIGLAVYECPWNSVRLRSSLRKPVEQRLAHDGRAERQEAARDALRQAHHVGLHVRARAGEQRARAAEAGHAPRRRSAARPPPGSGAARARSVSSLHMRIPPAPSTSGSTMSAAISWPRAASSASSAASVAALRRSGRAGARPRTAAASNGALNTLARADAHRAERVAVVGVLQRAMTPRGVPRLCHALQRDLHRRLDRRRAVVARGTRASRPARQHAPPAPPRARAAGSCVKPAKITCSSVARLLRDRLRDARLRVPVQCHPPARDRVEERAARRR